MSVQLYCKSQDGTQYVNLDLNASEPIKMVLSVANIEDPLASTSSFSRTFKVPHTGINGPYFKGVFNVNSVDYDAAKRADAYILDNGQFFANGQIILNSIYRNEKDKNVEYEITFLGETSDFGAKIGGGFMNQINMNHLNHAKSYDNITASWNNGLFGGDVVYGLIEWGYTYNANNQPVQPTLSNGFAKSFTLPANPLRLSQWKPQYRAKALWDQIFKESGYTYDSTFLNSALFKQLYIISDNVSSAELNSSNTFKVQANSVGAFTNASYEIPFTSEVNDPGNNFNLVLDSYTAPVTGLYDFRFSGTTELGDYNSQGGNSAGGTIEFYNQTGTVLGSIGISFNNSGYDPYGQNVYTEPFDEVIQMNINQNDVIKARLIIGPDGVGGSTASVFYYTWECYNAPQVLSATGILPATIKKIDFMKSIINRFRLIFVPSRDIENHFVITPWKDWILEGTTRDWTNKLDDSKDIKIRPLFYGQNRFQVYKDQDDADYLNYNYQQTYKQPFGQLNFDSTNELITGSKEYKDQFAPTPIAPIGYKEGDLAGSRFLIPHIAKDTGSTDDAVGTTVITGKREPIQPKLRLVFYNGTIAAPVTWYMANTDTGVTYVSRTSYPLMSQYSTWPVVASSTYDLNWKNETPFWNILDSTLGTGATTLTSYNVYWKTWNDQVFDPYSRIIEANITLDYNDILDLRFNDYIFLKDAWYVVNKVNDYIPGQTTNCRVELVKLGNIGVTIPYVTPVVYIPVNLCFSNTATACDVFCCNNVVTNSQTYYIKEGFTFATAETLYQDQIGTIPAVPGIYSDGISINEYSNGGLLFNTYNPVLCDCNPPAGPYEFSVIRGKFGCDVCCGDGYPIIVYGVNTPFETNALIWLDEAMTIPAPNGYYTPGLPQVAQYIGGQVTAEINCETCNCLGFELYPHTVKYSTLTVCKACRCSTTISVWTDSPSWEFSSIIYGNNVGTALVLDGWYNKDNWVLETSMGTVIDEYACPLCAPCFKQDPIQFDLEVPLPGYSSTATLESSNDSGLTWLPVGSVSILPTDSVLVKSETLLVDEFSTFRIIATTDIVGGTMDTTLTINGISEATQKTATPGSTTTIYGIPVSGEDAFIFNLNVVGGEPLPTATEVLVGGSFNAYNGVNVSDAILSLDPTGAITTPDFLKGLTQGGIVFAGFVWDIKKWNEKWIIAGIFDHYNEIPITNGLIVLNEDGSIYTPFQTLIGAYSAGGGDSPYGRWVEVVGDIAYTGGEFTYWNESPLGSGGTNYYLDSPKMVAINLIDGSINKTFNAKFDGTDREIEVIKEYGGYIYVGGLIVGYNGDGGARWLLKLDTTGAKDPAFNTNIGNYVTDMEFEGSYIYVAGALYGGIDRLDLTTGLIDVTWTHELFDADVEAINIVGDLIYCVGDFTAYGIDPINRIVAINKNTGAIDPTFNVGTGLNGRARNAVTDGTNLYVTGDFTDYNGTVNIYILKVALATGAKDPIFDTGTGFNGITIGLYASLGGGVNPFNCNLTSLSYNAKDACRAYCNYATTYGDYWINSPDLITASLILSSTQCGIGGDGNPAGFYSDGNVIANVGADGVILGFVDATLCNCGPNVLYPFTVSYSEIECDACCGTGTYVTVWSTTSVYNESTVLYGSSDASTFAPIGFYVNASINLHVISNGAVAALTFCECVCPILTCSVFKIKNLSAAVISYSYTDCSDTFQFGDIAPYATHNTTCTGNVMVTGSYSLTAIACE